MSSCLNFNTLSVLQEGHQAQEPQEDLRAVAVLCDEGRQHGDVQHLPLRDPHARQARQHLEPHQASGQPNIILVRFRPNFLAKISFGFGISAFISFGIRQKHTFRPKEAVLARIDLI